MKRYVAIDQVCAWPRLLTLSNGGVLAVIFDQPTPALWAGSLACWHSSDRGTTWFRRAMLSPQIADVTFLNAAVGIQPDGTLLAMYAGFGQRPPIGQPAPIDEETTLPTVVSRSTDGGYTWTDPIPLAPPFPGCREITPYGRIIPIAPGRSATVLYGYQNKSQSFAYLYETGADGIFRSVGSINEVGPSIDETELFAFEDGQLLAFGRTHPDRRIVMYSSPDCGISWNYLGPVTGAGESPASVCQAKNGNLILTYAYQHVNRRGIAARYTSDRGVTWSRALQLADYDVNAHGGHPSTVCLSNGDLLTGYFAERTSCHHRYHMAVVLWSIDDFC